MMGVKFVALLIAAVVICSGAVLLMQSPGHTGYNTTSTENRVDFDGSDYSLDPSGDWVALRLSPYPAGISFRVADGDTYYVGTREAGWAVNKFDFRSFVAPDAPGDGYHCDFEDLGGGLYQVYMSRTQGSLDTMVIVPYSYHYHGEVLEPIERHPEEYDIWI